MVNKQLLDASVRPIEDLRAWLSDHISREQARLLIALLVFSLLVLGFIGLADQVTEGETRKMDERLFLMLHEDDGTPIGPEWVEEIGRDATALGGNTILTLVALAVFGYLGLNQRWKDASIVAISVIGGVIVSLLLKELFDRPRPDLVPHLSHTLTSSFPSGHSMLAAVTYLTLGALVAEMAERKRQVVYPLVVALLLTVMVGVSRVHVGVHWPTDVLGGWMMGAAWALLCWTVIRWLQRHRALTGKGDESNDPIEQDRLTASDE
ncbi:phosphatase PAP2 family protein [Halomonas denitrificans]|nr:phosphatase PAP2 family protein [Halomonas denitrificans]